KLQTATEHPLLVSPLLQHPQSRWPFCVCRIPGWHRMRRDQAVCRDLLDELLPQAAPGSLELLLHHIDVLTACGEVVETVRGVKHDLAAAQAEQVFVGLT